MRSRTLLLAAALAAAIAPALDAKVLVVCGDGSGDATTIQAAVDLAQNGDEVHVCPGTYAESVDLKGKAIRVVAVAGPAQTVVDATGLGASAFVCVSFETPQTVIEGFTIRGGSGTPSTTTPVETYGGGLYARFSAPTVRSCVFEQNHADLGGGLLAFQTPPMTIQQCTFKNNSAKLGGGLFNNGGTLLVEGCSFAGNHAQITGGGMLTTQGAATLHECVFDGNQAGFDGGGLYNSLNSSDVVECDFLGNQAGFDGGGVYNWSSTSLLDRCTFVRNGATRGGGVLNFMASPTIADSLFEGNTAQEGAAIYSWNSDSATTNTSITNNHAGNTGGGIFSSGGFAKVRNSIVWGNTAPLDPNVHLDPGTPLEVDHSDVEGSGGSGPAWKPAFGQDFGGNLDADPLFADAAGGDFHLQPGSPCIDQGANPLLPAKATLDLDGFARVVDGAGGGPPVVDLGAYEFGASPWKQLGGGIAGQSGLPSIQGDGPLLPATNVTLGLSNAAPLAPALLVVGAAQLDAPFLGGLLVPTPDLVLAAGTTDSGGALSLSSLWPAGVPSGTMLFFQYWIPDGAAPAGWASTPGLEGTTP